MKFIRPLTFLILIFLGSACASLAQDITPPPGYEYVPPPPTQDIMYYPSIPPNPVAGQAIFVEKCQPCHGEQGLGNGPDANELPNPVSPIGTAELARQSNPGDWFQVVTEGRIDRFMPPFLSLTERQRWDVIAYVYTLSAPEETVTRGQELYQTNCASCHGDTGLGDGADAVNFSGGVTSFGNQFLMAERSKAELYEGMKHPNLPEIPDVTIGLTESKRWALTDYLRTLTFARPEEEIVAENPLATPATPLATEEDSPPELEETPVAGIPEAPTGAGEGIISGQVVNRSGGELPSGLEVVLYGFDQFQQVMSTTISVEADGTYQLSGVEIPVGRAYIASTEYKGTTYTSDLAVIEEGVTTYLLPISVYETTTDTSGLVVERFHILFEFLTEGQIRIAELIIISNLSNQVVVPTEANSPVLTYALPASATNLQFQDGILGQDFVETADGFGDLRPVPPGNSQHQVLFSFDLPYDSGLEIVQPLNIPVSNLVALLPDVGVKVQGSGLVSGGLQDVQGVPYEVFSAGGLSAGSELSLSLTGKPNLGTASMISTGSNSNLAIGLGALGVAILGTGVWLYRRGSKNTPLDEDGEEDEALDSYDAGMDKDSLIDAIIALDDRFNAGELPEEPYLQRRAVLKEQLRKMLESEN